MKSAVAHYQSTYLKQSENWIATQIRGIERYESIVITKRRRNRQLFPDQRVYSLDSLPAFYRQFNRLTWHMTGAAPYFRRLCARENIRAIHAWFGYSGESMLALAKRLSVPLITSFLGSDFTRGDVQQLRARYQKLFARGDAFLAEGPAAAERLVALGCPADKLSITPIAIDVGWYRCVTKQRRSDEQLRVLMAARFTEKKGLEYGVEAFCRFVQAGGRARLTVVGGATDAEGETIAAELQRIVRQFHCAGHIDFVGWKNHDELVTLLQGSDVFMHPSVTARNGDAEGGHPVVLTEAAASGTPIIGTRHCDIPAIVRDNETGWLVAERDVGGLVDALTEAYRMPERVQWLGQNARRFVESHYDVRNNRLDRIYSHLRI